MMFCLKCGKQLEDGAKFCPFCGAVTAAGAGEGPTAPAGPTAPPPQGGALFPEEGKKRRGAALIIGCAAAVVAVAALAVVLASGLFTSPKGRVEKALAKTVAAYGEVGKKMDLPDLSGLGQGRSGTQRVSLELGGINREAAPYMDLSSLRGLGVRAESSWNQKGRAMSAEAGVFLDGEDILSARVTVDGSGVYLTSPELTKGDVYGLNTETLGADLDRLGVYGGEVDLEDISFNLFDLMEKLTPSEEQAKEMKAAAAAAGKELFDAITVEKGGKKSVQVNGVGVDADLYKVVIPEGAMKDYISAMQDAMEVVDSEDLMKDALLSIGLDKSTVNRLLSGMNVRGPYKEMASSLKQLVKTIGDVELDVYVSGGYLSAVEYSDRIEGERVEMGLYLGGGDSYVDDLSLEFTVDGNGFLVESSGNHAGDKGVFTDETVLQIGGAGRVTSQLRYEPKSKSNNFQWELEGNNAVTLEAAGQLDTTGNSLSLRLDDISVRAMGMEMFSLEGSYYLGPYEKAPAPTPTMMLADMDKDDLEDLYYDIQDNVRDWEGDVANLIPEEVFWYLF